MAANEGIKRTRGAKQVSMLGGWKCGKTPSETEGQAKGKDSLLMAAGFLAGAALHGGRLAANKDARLPLSLADGSAKYTPTS